MRVRDIDFTIIINEYTRWQIKLARTGAPLTNRKQQVTVLIKELDGVKQGIHHVNMAGCIHRDPFGS